MLAALSMARALPACHASRILEWLCRWLNQDARHHAAGMRQEFPV